ncbi:MAG: phosphoesterase [Thermoplasmata archaeon]|nr:phosphoesterase [Thermoplasmata archaeon]
MAASQVTPLRGLPALRVDPSGNARPWLIVADLHLGLTAGERGTPGPPEGSPNAIRDQLLAACDSSGVRRLVVAGDVKHPIVGTPRSLRPSLFGVFADLLAAGVEVDVVLGNHDVGLAAHLPREVTVHPADGLLRDGVGVFHGHRWPSKRVLGADRLVAGHLHPGYRFASTGESASGKMACWVRAEFEDVPVGDRPRRFAAKELIVLPAFHPLAGREALNRQRPRRSRSFLFGRFLGEGSARAYLLDGTDVGPIVTPASTRRSGSPRRARPAP